MEELEEKMQRELEELEAKMQRELDANNKESFFVLDASIVKANNMHEILEEILKADLNIILTTLTVNRIERMQRTISDESARAE